MLLVIGILATGGGRSTRVLAGRGTELESLDDLRLGGVTPWCLNILYTYITCICNGPLFFNT